MIIPISLEFLTETKKVRMHEYVQPL